MGNKQVVLVVVVIVVLVVVCVVAAPALMDVIRTIHVIPQH
jgi:hypothetical protein